MNARLDCFCHADPEPEMSFADWLESGGGKQLSAVDGDSEIPFLQHFDRQGNKIGMAEWAWRVTYNPFYKVVKHTHLDDGGLISTVWLGTDHCYSMEPHRPVIFETMVFGVDGWDGEWDNWQDRYETEDLAMAGHWMVEIAVADGKRPPA